ncbi:unannotated protein [freshwater metagenome]|uniref:Unannotated protein n=1 Tax=freshwater metagenome TaxID=449393 RepID=A0A6J6J809_9ZZZZ
MLADVAPTDLLAVFELHHLVAHGGVKAHLHSELGAEEQTRRISLCSDEAPGSIDD